MFPNFLIINGEHFVRSAARMLLPMSVRQRLRETLRDVFFKPPPPLGADERRELQFLFRDDIRELEKLLGRDLSVWLE